jgi:hypothetical protein
MIDGAAEIITLHEQPSGQRGKSYLHQPFNFENESCCSIGRCPPGPLAIIQPQVPIKTGPDIKLGTRSLLQLCHELLECHVTVLEAKEPPFNDSRHSLAMTNGLANNESSRHGAQYADAALEGTQLVLPAEEVQDHAEVNDVESGRDAVQGRGGVGVENVGVHELSAQRGPVTEQLVAQFDKRRLELCAVERRRRRPIEHQPPQVLCHTAPYVEQLAALVTQLGHNARVCGEPHHCQFKETELTDAWVRMDFPGLVALQMMRSIEATYAKSLL